MDPLPDAHARILADKLFDGQLAVFAGAGLSHLCPRRDGGPARLPLWNDLAAIVADRQHEDASAYRDVLDLFDAIVFGQDRLALEQAVRGALDDSPYDLSSAHNELAKLPWAAVLTTNYDGLIARMFGGAIVANENAYDLLSQRADRQPKVFQVHGTLVNPHTLTREDYRDWEAKHPRAFRHFESLVLNKTVLFIGYSMSDPHFDALLYNVRRMTKGREKRLYAWTWRIEDGQQRLLDRRDKIEAIRIDDEQGWAAAFRQVGALLQRRKTTDAAVSISVSDDPFAYDRQQYLTGALARYGSADLQSLYIWGAGYARDDVSIERVFVEPELETANSPHEAGTAVESAAPASTVGSLEAARAQRMNAGASGSKREHSLEVIEREPKLLIIGAPGQGKSTLVRHVLLKKAAAWAQDPALPFPVLVRLSDWEADLSPTEGRLLGYARDRVRRLGEISSAAVDAWMARPILWLLDGVDEVRDDHQRSRLMEEITATSKARGEDRWVVTSRPAGDPQASIGPAWRRAVMAKLTPPIVEEILKRWASVLDEKEGLQLDAAKLARSLARDPGLRDVRTNALLLTLTVLFFKSRKRLPDGRWEFYDAAQQALRDAWVRHRLREAQEHLPGDYLPELLEQLALAGMEEGTVLFPLDRVALEAKKLLAARSYTGREQDTEIARLTRAAQDLIGVLVEQGPGRVGFLHLTFQEFFAARALVHRSGESRRFVETYWRHPSWHEVWLLYALGLQADERRHEEFLETILASRDPDDESLQRANLAVLRLAGMGARPHGEAAKGIFDWAATEIRSGTYLGARALNMLEAWERGLPRELQDACSDALRLQTVSLRAALALAANGEMSSGVRLTESFVDEPVMIARALTSYPPQGSMIDKLLEYLQHDNDRVRGYAVDALSAVAADQRVWRVLTDRLVHDPSWIVRYHSAEGLKDAASVPEVQKVLLQSLAHSDTLVRVFAGRSLASLRGALDFTEILRRLNTELDARRFDGAVNALRARASEPPVRESLLRLVTHGVPEVRSAALEALSDHAAEPAIRALYIDALRDTDASVRHRAAYALRPFAADDGVCAALVNALPGPSDWGRAAIVNVLATVPGRPEVRDALVRTLSQEVAREDVIAGLAQWIEEPSIFAAVTAFEADPSDLVRVAVCQTLNRVAMRPDARALLTRMLKDFNVEVQYAAAEALSAG